MMRIAILDKVDVAIAFMDNDAPGALHYYNDTLHEYLKGNASTFTFSTGTENEDCKRLIVGNKISFKYNNKDYYLNIVTVEQDENEITCTCYSTTFEFLNEYVGSYTATGAMSFQDYINAQINFEGFVTVDASAISDRRRTLSWDGETTLLERLYSIATGFEAEIKIEPVLSYNYSLQTIKIIAVPEYDESNNRYGIGSFRSDINIRWSKEIDSIRRTIDVTDFFSCIRPYGENGLTISGVASRNDTNSSGQVAWTHASGDVNIYAPLARDQIRSNTVNKSDGWIVRVKSYNTEDANQLYSLALKDLKEASTPKATYDIDGYFDTNIGDSVRIIDEGFNPDLYLIARVIEQVRSFTDPTQNKTTFSNVKELASAIDPSLVARMKALIAENTMLVGDITSDNGVVFKNNIGSTTLEAHVYSGISDVTSQYVIKWYKDGVDLHTVASTIVVFAKDVDGNSLYHFDAIRTADQKIIASYEVTVVNVLDGKSVTIKSSTKDHGTTTLILTEHDPTLLKDEDTKLVIYDGRGLISSNIQYYLSTSTQLVEGGEWIDNQRPEFVPGHFYWTRWKSVWREVDGSTTESYTDPVYDNAATVNSNTIYVTQEDAKAAKEIAENVGKTADKKNTIFYQSDPPSKDDLHKVNDIWFDTDDGNAIYYWNGSDWEKQPLANSAISNLDAGKITTGYLSADRIASNSINGDKIVANSITGAKIAAGTITATEIASGTITAEKIDVKDLFAQDITATGTIRGCHLIGVDIKNGLDTFKVDQYGNLTATSGKIAGFTITDSYLYTGTGSNSSGIGTAGTSYAFWAGGDPGSGSPKFAVSHGGEAYCQEFNSLMHRIRGSKGTTDGWIWGDGTNLILGCNNEVVIADADSNSKYKSLLCDHVYANTASLTGNVYCDYLSTRAGMSSNYYASEHFMVGYQGKTDSGNLRGDIFYYQPDPDQTLYFSVYNRLKVTNLDHTSLAYIDALGVGQGSSKVIKENIKDETEESARRLLNVRIVSFDYKKSFGGLKEQRGVIAEEVKDIIPEAVHIPNGWDESKYDGKSLTVPSVDYIKFVPDLIKMIQIQQKQIDSLEERINGR